MSKPNPFQLSTSSSSSAPARKTRKRKSPHKATASDTTTTTTATPGIPLRIHLDQPIEEQSVQPIPDVFAEYANVEVEEEKVQGSVIIRTQDEFNFKYARMRFWAYCNDPNLLNVYLRKGIKLMKVEVHDLSPVVLETFRWVIKDTCIYYKLYVLFALVLAVPTFRAQLRAFCGNWPLDRFLCVLRNHIDIFFRGQSMTGTFCLEDADDRRYPSILSFVGTMRSVIFSV